MSGSMIAASIDNEYRTKKAFKKKTRQKCRFEGNNCETCKYSKICLDADRR